MRERFVRANGLRFHVVEDGPDDGPLALLLHGFPEFWFSWRHQIPALAARGFHVAAPDLRGYNLTDKPDGVAAYDLDELARDVASLVPALGGERAALVGHDWGAVVAWHAAARHPERVERLVAIACPPLEAMARGMLRDPAQLRRSWYTLAFQVPRLPEALLGGRLVLPWMRGWATRAGAFTDEDGSRYVEAASRPGAMRAAVNYYRASLRRTIRIMRRERAPRVAAPTLVIWGGADRILGRALTRGLDRWAGGPLRVEILEGVGHFVPQEAPEAVNALLGAFLDGD